MKGESYGGANAWGGVTIDEQRGWVFAATGSATEDFYGGFRKGSNLFANSVLALDATTGERKWHYQTVRHDLWDYDNPPAPILVTLRTGNASRDAVVQLTKMGFTFVLDRETGQPLFPVQEIPVPGSTVPGEETAPTQPIPLKPQPLVRQSLTEADLTNITPEAHAHALKEFRKYLSGPIYTPPEPAGHDHDARTSGRVEWHGASFDPLLNVLVRQRQRGADDQQAQGADEDRRRGDQDSGRSRSIHDRRLPAVPRSARRAGHLAAVGHAERDRPRQGRDRLEGPSRRVSATRREGHPQHRHAELRRRRGNGGRRDIRRGDGGREDPRVRKALGTVLWEHQLPAGGYATPSVYMVEGRQYVVIAAGGSGKNATKSGDSIIAFALPQSDGNRRDSGQRQSPAAASEWIDLFDGSTLNGWVHMNGAHTFTVEDGAIVGRTVESSASMNSFLCSLQEFDDFELELETTIDRITNSGIQIRTQVRPVQGAGRSFESSAGRVNGPQVEVRRFYKGQPTTGLLYGEAIGTGWLSSQQKIDEGHRYFIERRLEQAAHRRPGTAHSDVGQRSPGRRSRERGGVQDPPQGIHRPANPRRERTRAEHADPRRVRA